MNQPISGGPHPVCYDMLPAFLVIWVGKIDVFIVHRPTPGNHSRCLPRRRVGGFLSSRSLCSGEDQFGGCHLGNPGNRCYWTIWCFFPLTWQTHWNITKEYKRHVLLKMLFSFFEGAVKIPKRVEPGRIGCFMGLGSPHSISFPFARGTGHTFSSISDMSIPFPPGVSRVSMPVIACTRDVFRIIWMISDVSKRDVIDRLIDR